MVDDVSTRRIVSVVSVKPVGQDPGVALISTNARAILASMGQSALTLKMDIDVNAKLDFTD